MCTNVFFKKKWSVLGENEKDKSTSTGQLTASKFLITEELNIIY